MIRSPRFIALALMAVLLLPFTAALSQFLQNPQPGEIFREYSLTLRGGPAYVTDPNTQNPTARLNLRRLTVEPEVPVCSPHGHHFVGTILR